MYAHLSPMIVFSLTFVFWLRPESFIDGIEMELCPKRLFMVTLHLQKGELYQLSACLKRVRSSIIYLSFIIFNQM